MQRGIWGRFGWMLLAAAVLIGGALFLKGLVTGKDEDQSSKAA